MQNPSPHLSLTPRMIRVIFFTNYIHMWFLTCVLQTWIGQIDTMWVTCYIRCAFSKSNLFHFYSNFSFGLGCETKSTVCMVKYLAQCSSISSNGDVLTLGKIQSDVWTICRLLTVNWSYCFLHGQVIWKKNERNNKKKKNQSLQPT